MIELDQSLVRRNDPPDVRGDPTLIRRLVGWEAGIKLEQTLIDLLGVTAAMAVTPLLGFVFHLLLRMQPGPMILQ